MRIKLFNCSNVCSYWMIFPFACALVVIGARCWVINTYGSPTPYWDQWDAEAAFLYKPYFSGTLRLFDLIAPHNEHRILITRLWSLLLLELNGYWDPILQMVSNALLSGLITAMVVSAFRQMLDIVTLIVLTLFSIVIFALPLTDENILGGFQSQWYFLVLASLSGLIVLHGASAFTTRWWLATLLLCLSYFCMAGGTLTMAAASTLCLIQLATGRRSGLRELSAIALLATLCVGFILYTPSILNTPSDPRHIPMSAQSIGQFFWALLQIGSWPMLPMAWKAPAVVALFFAVIYHVPAIVFSAYVILQRPAITDRRWLVVALTGWSILNAAALAYGRALLPISSRYFDLYSITLVLNCACLLSLVRSTSGWPLRRNFALCGIAIWLMLVLPNAVAYSINVSAQSMASRKASGQIQTENLRAYLRTNDINFLANKPMLSIPYPDAWRLAVVANEPVIRAILPPALVGEASATAAQQRGVARFTSYATGAFKEFMLDHGALLIPIGIAFFLTGILIQGLQTKPIESSTGRSD